jgi:beta-barrel assembly-enhancing protease
MILSTNQELRFYNENDTMGKYFVLILMIITAGCASSKQADHPRFREISKEDVKELEYAAIVEEKLYAQFNVAADHSAVPHLNEIAEVLQSRSRRPYWPLEVFVITDPRYINACTGGRNVYIGQGLLDLSKTDDELAYIIAHELAHIDESHPMKTFESAQKVGIFRKIGGYATSIAFAFVPAGAVNPAVSFAAQNSIAMINQAATDIINKGYKRSFEIEADKKAVEFMQASGYDPQAALSVLIKLEQASKVSPGGLFSDHPAYDHRIEDIKKILSQTE